MTTSAQELVRSFLDRGPLRVRNAASAAKPARRLGATFIGVGATLVFALRSFYELVWFAVNWRIIPDPETTVAAWAILVVVVVGALIAGRVAGGHLPDWAFAVFLGGLALAIALDLVAIWPLEDIGRHATASVAGVMALVAVITLRPATDIVLALAGFGVALATAMAINTQPEPDDYAAQVTALSFAVLPVVIGVVVVVGFRRLVQVELDRVLVQSTVSGPRLAVGMMASEELARLDLAAEELLESVASGVIPLPLDPSTASVAASLATELRLHLIEGRRETWLYHAITESEMLGKSVTLIDRTSLAGLLDPRQRDGLLSTVWLLLTETDRGRGRSRAAQRTMQIILGPRSTEVRDDRMVRIPIVITTTAISRNRVDTATWDAIRRVGRYTESSHRSNLRIAIDCLVSQPG